MKLIILTSHGRLFKREKKIYAYMQCQCLFPCWTNKDSLRIDLLKLIWKYILIEIAITFRHSYIINDMIYGVCRQYFSTTIIYYSSAIDRNCQFRQMDFDFFSPLHIVQWLCFNVLSTITNLLFIYDWIAVGRKKRMHLSMTINHNVWFTLH